MSNTYQLSTIKELRAAHETYANALVMLKAMPTAVVPNSKLILELREEGASLLCVGNDSHRNDIASLVRGIIRRNDRSKEHEGMTVYGQYIDDKEKPYLALHQVDVFGHAFRLPNP